MTNLFFIVGCGRSGTTMLQQALNRHSQVAIPPEMRFFAFLRFARNSQRQHLHRIVWDLGIDLSFPSKRITTVHEARELYFQIATLYLQRLAREGIRYFGEKTPENALYFNDLFRAFPEAKMIFIYRDGRDVAISLTKVPWSHPDLFVNFAVWLYYHRVQKAILRERPESVHFVKYEALVANPQPEMQAILAFLELPYEAHVIEEHGNREGIPEWERSWKAGALERINESRVGVWKRELMPSQVAILERIGGWALTSLGYELVTSGKSKIPLSFFPKLLWDIGVWRARKLIRAIEFELWKDEFAVVDECKRKLIPA